MQLREGKGGQSPKLLAAAVLGDDQGGAEMPGLLLLACNDQKLCGA